MGDKTDLDVFLEHVTLYNVWYKALLVYLYHFIIFIFIIASFWLISSNYWWVAIPAVFTSTCISNFPFIYMFIRSDKIREKYQKKFKKLPWQHFWLHYSYTSPFGAAALYFPLMLKTDYFLPKIVNLPSTFFTNSLFPIYVAIPLGIIICIIAILFMSPSQNFDGDMGNYLHIMLPDKNRLLRGGIYKYIRHPRFFCRLILSIGFGILANNILAILAAIIHFIPYYMFMIVLDKQLIRIFGEDVKKYIKNTPAFIPRYTNWKMFSKELIGRKKSN